MIFVICPGCGSGPSAIEKAWASAVAMFGVWLSGGAGV